MSIQPLGLADVEQAIATIQTRFAPTPGSDSAAATSSSFANALAAADPSTGTAAPGASPSGRPTGADVVADARKYLGVPYRWGGTDPRTGLDCSGLVQRAYGDLGIQLPRVSQDQAQVGSPVGSLADAIPGDLVCFGSPAHHIGIYVGNGMMIEAPHTGDVVKIAPVGDPTSIRRVIPGGDATSASAAAGDATPANLRQVFAAAGARYGVPPALLAAVARVESGFDPTAVSSAGAEGLMQLMPSTASGLGVDPMNPAQAVDGAARLLSGYLQRYGGSQELALAAYNAGPGAVASYGGVPPYAETQAYVRRVLADEGSQQL